MSTFFLKASSKRDLRNISCKSDEVHDPIITQMSTSLYPLVLSVLLLSRKSTEHLTPADVYVKTTPRLLTTRGTYKLLIWMLSSNEKSISVGHWFGLLCLFLLWKKKRKQLSISESIKRNNTLANSISHSEISINFPLSIIWVTIYVHIFIL